MKFDIWVFFLKSVAKIQISLKSDKNNGYVAWRPIYVLDRISLKGGDTLSSRHVSSCDVTRAVGMWEAI